MTDAADQRLRDIGDVATVLGAALQPFSAEQRLQRLVDTAREVFGAQACSIALVDLDGETLEFRVASGRGATEVLGTTMPVSVGIAGWVVASGQAIAVSEVTNDPRFAREVAEQTGYVPTTILAAPLETPQTPIGVIEILDRGDTTDGSRDLLILALLAQLAAETVVSARLFSDTGRILLGALAETSEASLASAIQTTASEIDVPSDLVEIAELLADLHAAAPSERELAVELLSTVLAHRKASGAQ